MTGNRCPTISSVFSSTVNNDHRQSKSLNRRESKKLKGMETCSLKKVKEINLCLALKGGKTKGILDRYLEMVRGFPLK